jgi:hypothetical protein
MFDGAAYHSPQRPLYINCHSGRDFFSMEENGKFIDYTTKVAKETGIMLFVMKHTAAEYYTLHM